MSRLFASGERQLNASLDKRERIRESVSPRSRRESNETRDGSREKRGIVKRDTAHRL